MSPIYISKTKKQIKKENTNKLEEYRKKKRKKKKKSFIEVSFKGETSERDK
jgi:hypothetical protein